MMVAMMEEEEDEEEEEEEGAEEEEELEEEKDQYNELIGGVNQRALMGSRCEIEQKSQMSFCFAVTSFAYCRQNL